VTDTVVVVVVVGIDPSEGVSDEERCMVLFGFEADRGIVRRSYSGKGIGKCGKVYGAGWT